MIVFNIKILYMQLVRNIWAKPIIQSPHKPQQNPFPKIPHHTHAAPHATTAHTSIS